MHVELAVLGAGGRVSAQEGAPRVTVWPLGKKVCWRVFPRRWHMTEASRSVAGWARRTVAGGHCRLTSVGRGPGCGGWENAFEGLGVA